MRLTIGSRGSQLALAQTRAVCDLLAARRPGIRTRVEIIRTQGDVTAGPLRESGGQGLFTSQLESALVEGRIDLAVHSLKDLPVRCAAELVVVATPEREDVRDALVGPGVTTLAALPQGARLGTGSLRRRAQLLALRPDLDVRDVRGNVDTRIGRTEAGDLDAVVLAAAGLHRLGLQARIGGYLAPAQMLPAVGQGALGLQMLSDHPAAALVADLDHAPTHAAVEAERALLDALGGGCHAPIAAWARLEAERLLLDGLVASQNGAQVLRHQLSAPPEQAAELGRRLAALLCDAGAAALLGEAPA